MPIIVFRLLRKIISNCPYKNLLVFINYNTWDELTGPAIKIQDLSFFILFKVNFKLVVRYKKIIWFLTSGLKDVGVWYEPPRGIPRAEEGAKFVPLNSWTKHRGVVPLRLLQVIMILIPGFSNFPGIRKSPEFTAFSHKISAEISQNRHWKLGQ